MSKKTHDKKIENDYKAWNEFDIKRRDKVGYLLTDCNYCYLKEHSKLGFEICPICKETSRVPIPLSEVY